MTQLRLPLVLLFTILALGSTAQLELKNKHTYHIGLQANPLLRQILNFGANEEVNNPYLLRAEMRLPNSRNEISLGLGLSFINNETNNSFKTNAFNSDIRLGLGRKYLVGKRFEAGIAIDLLGNFAESKTVSVNNFGGGSFVDSTISTTTTNGFGFGLGPRLNFDYYLTDNIKLGTEASFYWQSIQSEQKVVVENFTSDFNGNIVYNRTDDKDELSQSSLNIFIPVVIYLTVIF